MTQPRVAPPALAQLLASPYRYSLLAATVAGALAPAYVIRWKVGPLPTTLLEVAILATIAVFAVETIQHRLRIEWHGPLTPPAILFIVAGAISVLVSGDHRGALGLYRAYFLEPAAFFLIVGAVASTPRRAGLILLGFAAGGAVAAVLNASVVLDAIRHHVLDLATTPPVVIYQTANAVSLYLIPLVAMAAAILLHGRGRAERWLSGLFLAVALPACLLSFSRGGYLALAAVALGLAISHRWAKLLVPAVVLAALAVSQVPLIRHRIAYELHAVPGNTLDFRLRIWGQTLRMLSHSPVLGIGLSYYQQAMGPYWQDLPRVIYPHNIVLNFWSVTGLLGLAGFFWLAIRAFLLGWRGWRRHPAEWRPYDLGVMLVLVAMLVHGLVDVPFFKNDLSFEFWALLGILWAAHRWSGAGAALYGRAGR
jgi:O-antigen ligase